MKEIIEIYRQQLVDRMVNWSIVAYPTAGWATQVFGEADIDRLWNAVAFCTGSTSPTRSPPGATTWRGSSRVPRS